MNKKMLLVVATAVSVLAGCQTYDRAASYVKEPVVSDVKVGVTNLRFALLQAHRLQKRRLSMRKALARRMLWLRVMVKHRLTLSAITTPVMS